MPIPKAKIEEARSIVASGEYAGEGYWRETTRALLSEREEMLTLLQDLGFTHDGMCRECGKGWRGGADACKPDCRLAAFLR